MSGDVQPRKRKDKKRKKDDEDTVKETSTPKHIATSAAQAATQPGDVQMHIHSDHGTGGNWCAKIVFFLLLTGLGVLIGLIIIENRGVSNADTPLSESRYAEYLNGWVDENREDDHHHEEILNAINQLEEEEDHDEDEGHGEPYAEEEDHDDEQDGEHEDDEEEEEEAVQKLDDDEVEEILAVEKVSTQEAEVAEEDDGADEDDDNENDNNGNEEDDADVDVDEDEDDDDVDVDGESDDNEAITEPNENDENDEDNDEEQDGTKDTEEATEVENEKDVPVADQPDDDDDDQPNDEDGEDDANDADSIAKEIDELADADDDDNTPFDEEANKQKIPLVNENAQLQQKTDPSQNIETQPISMDAKIEPETPVVSAEILKTQMDELVENYNKLAEMLNVPKEQRGKQDDNDNEDDDDDAGQVVPADDEADDDNDNIDNHGDDEDDNDANNDDDDDDDVFENVVDNDGGEEEYLAKVRKEQELKNQISKEQEKEDPREESSLAVQLFVGAALVVVAVHLLLKPPRGPSRSEPAASYKRSEPTAITSTVSNSEEILTKSEKVTSAATKKDVNIIEQFVNQTKDFDPSTVNIEDFVNIGVDQHGDSELVEENVNEYPEEVSYSGEEDYDFEQEEYIDELEEIEEEEEQEYEQDQDLHKLEEQEREIGTFVPTTFEEFSAMYRSNATETDSTTPTEPIQITEPLPPITKPTPPPTKNNAPLVYKESPLMKKKPPKGAVNMLIYGLHKDPFITADDMQPSTEKEIPSRPSRPQTYAEELSKADRQLEEFRNAKQALASYEAVLIKQPRLIAALVGKARALDLLAEQEQCNIVLGEAIEAYRDVISMGPATDDETFKSVAERCIERIRFRGQYLKALDIHFALIKRFDSVPKYRNQLAVTYLLANRLAEAKAILHDTLLRWIDDGFALVHYGFVVKNHDRNMELAVQYLQEGIETGHEGTNEGRFYFHLGDALQRLGRNQEALDVYKKGAEQKLFLSMYQRSLYNVESLRSRPFWTIEQTTFASQLELIQSQWTAIRDEGLKLLNAAGTFKDEVENLRESGDWKQFELFLRGYRIDKNCAKAPLTCKLVEQFAAARTCKRGQVKFSVMQPGTHVWPHCGPTNCRIRAHLGLKVPDGVTIRVADEIRSWENGKWLIFDDSYEHEVWHNGTGTRLVLIVDFWHPDLSENQRKTLSAI
ncbi:aspartyl/asparaginyl beta-hydroxylase isoform X6 [Topomyia yanbarensis]|uniref:aspartyl/asparaginyl beta-hydroxylase isoform X6 n=1 Tax=Topomyia yanbarensis TaxID=2498891 RepID=UPI00273C47E7|nr:aspartyl/asparaginyl beta-hydroxylase isoform X6 [Topomyia yanbarensis]